MEVNWFWGVIRFGIPFGIPFVRGRGTGAEVPVSAVGAAKAEGPGKDGHRSKVTSTPVPLPLTHYGLEETRRARCMKGVAPGGLGIFGKILKILKI